MCAPYVSRTAYFHAQSLLFEGAAHDVIAAATSLDLETVAGIARGNVRPSRVAFDPRHGESDAVLAARRCAGCGGMVYVWPCLACQIASGIQPAGKRKQRSGARRRAPSLRPAA